MIIAELHYGFVSKTGETKLRRFPFHLDEGQTEELSIKMFLRALEIVKNEISDNESFDAKTLIEEINKLQMF